MRYFYLILLLGITTQSFGQDTENYFSQNTEREIAADFLLGQTRLYHETLYGIQVEAKYPLSEKLSSGILAGFAWGNSASDFGFNLPNPMLSMVQFGWINELKIAQTKRWELGVNLHSGLMSVQLNEGIVGGFFVDDTPIAIDYYFVLEPGVTTKILLTKPDAKHPVYWTSQLKYRKAFGNSNFSYRQEAENFWFGTGVTIKGLWD